MKYTYLNSLQNVGSGSSISRILIRGFFLDPDLGDLPPDPRSWSQHRDASSLQWNLMRIPGTQIVHKTARNSMDWKVDFWEE